MCTDRVTRHTHTRIPSMVHTRSPRSHHAIASPHSPWTQAKCSPGCGSPCGSPGRTPRRCHTSSCKLGRKWLSRIAFDQGGHRVRPLPPKFATAAVEPLELNSSCDSLRSSNRQIAGCASGGLCHGTSHPPLSQDLTLHATGSASRCGVATRTQPRPMERGAVTVLCGRPTACSAPPPAEPWARTVEPMASRADGESSRW